MQNTLLLLATLYSISICSAQHLIPFRDANGLYGYTTPARKVVTPPQFKKAWLPNEHGIVLAADKDDFIRVIRQDGTVLPATIAFKSYSEPVAYPVVNYAQGDFAKPDTLPDFRCIRSTDNQEFLLVKNGKSGWESRKYLSYEKLKSAVSIYGNYRPENYTYGPFTFYKGLHRVIKGEHRVNFINTNLEELFKDDYENGTILINGHIALASPESRFALADAQGKIRTGFIFRNIIGTEQPDFFVVNFTPGHSSGHVGLIRYDGNLVVDTVYESLAGITEDWVVAQKNSQFGVLDYTGNTVLPFRYSHLEYARGGHFIASEDWTNMTIVNIEGKALLEKIWNKIEYKHNWNGYELPYFEVRPDHQNGLRGVLDSNLNLLFLDTFSQISMTHRKFLVTGAKGVAFGLYDYSGKTLIPMTYSLLERMRDDAGYLVMRDSLFGFYTADGQMALPCRYTRIVPEQTPDGVILWAKTQRDKNLYAAFTAKGERLPIAEQIAPTLRAVEFKNCFVPDMVNGQWQLTLPDGSTVVKPRDYPNKNINVGTPDGCLMVEKADGKCRILDAYLKPIIPQGFFLPENLYRGPYLQMGLIPVYNQIQSGIINTRGEWVKKPGEFGYHILRPNMYSEHKGQPNEYNLEGATIHTITPESTKRVEVQYMNDKFRDGYLVIGRAFDDAPEDLKMRQSYSGKVFKYAVMDTLGNVLTPFMIARYPEQIKSRWLATVYEPDYSTKAVVFDSTGRIVFDFGKERVSGYDPERHWVYITDEQNKTGIRDTLGREILPVQYRELQWHIPGKLFSHRLSDGSKELCTAQGKPFLSGFKYVNYARELPDGYSYVITDSDCHILSPNLQVLCSAPGKEVEIVEKYPDLLRVKTEGGAVRYVNFRKGVVFGE
ncbi:MAG: hypothetical protein IPM98_18395 [Lewinellaceae bacterium]|nr:hypothetical protein [Lewinellaceae bacterium]